MKPDWKDAPYFANYLTCDENGDWYWHERKHRAIIGWELWASTGLFKRAIIANFDWRNTLEKRP